MTEKIELKCFDLCCGAGALAEGFRQGGAQVLGGIDINPSAIETATRNHPNAIWRQISIEEFSRNLDNSDGNEIRKANVILAGLPCQGFSVAGKGDPEDPRNSLYRHLLKIVARILPSYVVIENVSGLKFRRNSGVLKSIISGLRRLGYDVAFRVLNAIDFSVPQRRKRIFIIATLEYRTDWIYECIRHNGKCPTVREAFKYLSSRNENIELNHAFMKHGSKVTRRLINLKPGGPISYRRLEWDKPSITLIAGHRALPVHPSEPRAISVREAARIQGFEDKYRFKGSRTSQIEQVANAVPPALGKAIAKSLRRMASYQAGIHGTLYRKLGTQNSHSLRKQFGKAFRRIWSLQVRKFPWRSLKNPYKVLITEILLQRTNGELANSIWRNVLDMVPSAPAAGQVDLRSLRPLVRRIGIFSRASTIKKIGLYLCEKYGGRVPENFDELMRIPGVGLYISSAIRSLAYGQKDFPVDSNAFRFISRFFGVHLNGRKSEGRQIRELMLLMMEDVSHTKIREYVYGFLDFSATICRPWKPKCLKCLLRRDCSYFIKNT